MEDIRGITRGKCELCPCDSFVQEVGFTVTCSNCNHPPTKHQRMDSFHKDFIQLDGCKSSGHSGRKYIVNDDSDDSHEDQDDSLDDSQDDSHDNWHSYYGSDGEVAYFDPNTGISLEDQRDMPQQLSLSKTCKPAQCKLPGCTKACYVDDSAEQVFEFCCRSHGKEFQHQQQSQKGFPSGMKCKNPKCSKQKYQDDSKVYDFCGRTCRDKYMKSQQTTIGDVPSGGGVKCKNPQCSRQKYQDSEKVYDFCGRTCRDSYMQLRTTRDFKQPTSIGEMACLLPGCKLPRYCDPSNNEVKLFCGNGHKNRAASLVFLKLSCQMVEYQETISHFVEQWSQNKSSPPHKKDICAIFQIFNPKQANIFHEYRKSLTSSVIEQYYHGTSVKCDVLRQEQICSDSGCGLCGISKKGFCPRRFGFNIPRFKRFGDGFYLAPNSSKCHDYTQGHGDYRVMLLCDVAPGNKYTVQNDQTKLKAPPQGYDSVYGAHGGNLNYDEIVLYRSESILPKYAIVYKRDGIGKIAS